MGARSRQLGGIRATTATTYHALGTVPAGKRWLIKWWSVYSVPGSDVILSFLRGSDVWILQRTTVPATGSLAPGAGGCGHVLEPGDVLRVWSSVAGVTTTVSGIELEI